MQDIRTFVHENFMLKKSIIEKLLKNDQLALDEGKMSLEVRFEDASFKDALSKYTLLLNKYFPQPWKIFVVAKIRIPDKLHGILNIFFHNSKEDVVNEMTSFVPTYLLVLEDIRLLVNIEDKRVIITKLNIPNGAKRFVHDNYRYVIANEIKREKA